MFTAVGRRAALAGGLRLPGAAALSLTGATAFSTARGATAASAAQGAAAASAGQGSTPAATEAAASAAGHSTHQAESKLIKEDGFQFVEHCRGTRSQSNEAAELLDRLRRSDFGKPRSRKPAPGPGAAAAAQKRSGGLHTSAAAAAGEERGADDAAQEIVEKGSKRLMQSEDGREELRAGSFDLDRTTERVMEEGKKDASPEAAQRADDQDVKDSVKSRVVAGSQTS